MEIHPDMTPEFAATRLPPTVMLTKIEGEGLDSRLVGVTADWTKADFIDNVEKFFGGCLRAKVVLDCDNDPVLIVQNDPVLSVHRASRRQYPVLYWTVKDEKDGTCTVMCDRAYTYFMSQKTHKNLVDKLAEV